MSSKLIRGDEQEALSLFDTPKGATWEDIARCLDIAVDTEKAKREKQRKYVNSWIARKFGKGPNKTVYSVWSKELNMWVYKSINAMENDELQQVLTRETKNLQSASKRQQAIKKRIYELNVLMRTKMLDFKEERTA